MNAVPTNVLFQILNKSILGFPFHFRNQEQETLQINRRVYLGLEDLLCLVISGGRSGRRTEGGAVDKGDMEGRRGEIQWRKKGTEGERRNELREGGGREPTRGSVSALVAPGGVVRHSLPHQLVSALLTSLAAPPCMVRQYDFVAPCSSTRPKLLVFF